MYNIRSVVVPMGLFLLATIPLPSAGNRGMACHLDETWSGKWFEYGERDAISIDTQNMTHKGTCNRRKHDKYIFKDPLENCYRCAVMHMKHPNVLQYKESLCEAERRNPFDLCYSITADAPLKSLFRLDAKPTTCPIQGSFQFSYSRGHGVCNYPKSSISQCSDASKLVFRYQACADIKGSESTVESVECLAQWKEGSTYYFLGLISHDHVSAFDYEDRFRCFAYQEIFQGYLISQSGDAQCTLHSAKEGDKTMTLKKVNNHEKQCSLPHWMLQHHHTFRNLNGSIIYHFNTLGTSLTIKQSSLDKKLKCNTIEEETGNFTKIIMQVNFECESGFVCMEASRKSDSILSLRLGKLSRNPDEACNQHLFFDASIQPVIIVSAKHGQRERCPLVGKYALIGKTLENNNNEKSSCATTIDQQHLGSHQHLDHVTFGCAAGGATEFNVVQNNCNVSSTTANRITETSSYICHGGWKEPLASRNTFSKVQDLKDQQQSHMPQYQHSAGLYGGNGGAAGSLGPADQRHLQQYYVVISEAERPRQRICVRLVMDHDNSNVSLWANSRHCPPPVAASTASAAASNQPQYQLSNDRSSNALAGGLNQNNGQLWSFNLTRTSECAQALATANSATKLKPHILLQPLSTSLLILLLLPMLLQWSQRCRQHQR